MIGDLFDSPSKILIVALVIIVLFGSKKPRAAARRAGTRMRTRKREGPALHEEEPDPRPAGAQPAAQAPAELTAGASGGQAARQAQIGALQQQVGDLERAAAVDAEPQPAAAAAAEASRSARQPS